MDAPQRAISLPQVEIIMQRAARRQVLRDRPPLAAGAEDGHQPVDHRAHVDRPLAAAALRRAGSAAPPATLPRRSDLSGRAACCGLTVAVLRRPHQRPPRSQAAATESQETQPIQYLLGQTLRCSGWWTARSPPPSPSNAATSALLRLRLDPSKRSARAKQDADSRDQIACVFAKNLDVYGARKLWRQMMRQGFDVARCSVERRMQDIGLQGVIRGKPVRTTIQDKAAAPLNIITLPRVVNKIG